MILAIETATRVCSVALLDREGQVHERRTEERGEHSEKLFLFIEELLDQYSFIPGELDAMLVSEGPGSYTGLRIGASAVKGLLFNSRVPLYAVNTLAGFARAACDPEMDSCRVHAVIDARRVHLYHQLFEWDGTRISAKKERTILPIDKVNPIIREGDWVIGTGTDRLDLSQTHSVHTLDYTKISAVSLLHLFREKDSGRFLRKTAPEAFDPVYLGSGQVQ